MTRGLIVENLSVGYGTAAPVITDCSFTLEPQKTLALLGPSGCGKSTLLRALAGLEAVREGAIHWNGHDITHLPPHRRGIGFMFQDGQLFPHLDVTGNIEYGLKAQKVPAAQRRERVAELLQLVKLEEYAHTAVTDLSGGQSQRVALARTLAPQPELLLLDEPFSSLDADLRLGLAEEVQGILRAAKQTAILVTHDENEARRVADRVLRMPVLVGSQREPNAGS